MLRINGQNNKVYKCDSSENYLCVPTVLECIIKSEGFSTISRYDIANFFGVSLPEGVVYSEVTCYQTVDDNEKLGVTIKNDSVNQLFSFFRIPLRESFVSLQCLERDFFPDYIYKVLLDGKHIICGYDYNTLYKINSEYIGHVSVVYSISDDLRHVCIIDPGPKGFGIKQIDLDSLYHAIYRARDGLWIIEKDSLNK